MGIAQPQRLQTAIADTSIGGLRTSMTIRQQIDEPAIDWPPRQPGKKKTAGWSPAVLPLD